MICARLLSARANGSKGMRLRWKMVVCLGLLLAFKDLPISLEEDG